MIFGDFLKSNFTSLKYLYKIFFVLHIYTLFRRKLNIDKSPKMSSYIYRFVIIIKRTHTNIDVLYRLKTENPRIA